jgi:hypothetical protein
VRSDTCDRRGLLLSLCAALMLWTIPAPGAAQESPPAQVLPAPPAKAPLPNRLNEVLPSWLRVRSEFRERMEGFENSGFVDTRDDLYWLTRVRINAALTPSPALSFQVQVQDARVAKKTVGPTGTPFKAPLDVRMAFADVGSGKSPLTVRVGRQELAFGEQRLVGHLNWTNAARTFDAARVTLRTPAFQVDAFGASVVRIMDGAFDRSGNGNRFAGAYAATPKLLPRASVEPYVFWRRDVNQRSERGGLGTLLQTTVGARVAGVLPARFDYGVEMAAQRGSLDADELDAWAGHWQLRHALPGASGVRAIAEYNFASGDDNPADGIRGTFDQLYPTGHDKLGLGDQVGWRNIHHVRAGFDFTPIAALPVTASYHSWWLANVHDGLYAASGALLARALAAATNRHVGQEIDVQVTRALTPQIQLAAGYAHMFTGAFLKQATPGASYSHPFVMVTYVFLAER